MKNVDKYFSLKLINNKKESINNTKKSRTAQLDKAKSRSNEDLIEKEGDELDRSEEARMAEEALAANLKLLKKQKAKFLRLQKILSRNVILIPLCAIFSVLSAASIFASTLSDYYEHISYDINHLKRQIEIENNKSLVKLNINLNSNRTLSEFMNRKFYLNEKKFERFKDDGSINQVDDNPLPDTSKLSHSLLKQSLEQQQQQQQQQHQKLQQTQPVQPSTTNRLTTSVIQNFQLKNIYFYEMNNFKDYYILTRRNQVSNDNSSLKMNIIYPTYSGIWRLCNYLSEESRKTLNVGKCKNYTSTNIEFDLFTEEDLSDPARDLVRMHNAAACCIIVSYFLLIFSWVTGLAAAFTKKVPVTLATGVLNLLIAVFLALLIAIVHRKIVAEEKPEDCFDLKIVFNIVCSSRTIKYGYSLGLTWLALFFTTLSGLCWFHITKMQKLLFTHGYYYN